MKISINNVVADYDHNYNPQSSHNGGNYWQFGGSCTAELAGGTIISAELDDSSCGDFGRRSQLVLTAKKQKLVLWEDEISGRQEEAAEENTQTLIQLEQLLGCDSRDIDCLVDDIADTIESAAYSRYLDERRKEKEACPKNILSEHLG